MKIVKRILAVVGALLLLAVLGVVLKFYVLSPKMRPAPAMTAPTSPEAIARGKYLVHHVTGCVACHSPVRTDQPGEPYIEEKLGAGRVWEKDPSYPDWEIIAPNITPDKDTGLGNWSDGEIARAIREGVSKDGRPLFPMMPFQTYAATLSDDDTLAIIAYLRTLAPQSNKLAATKIGFPVSMFVRGVPAPLEKPSAGAPPASDKKARGDWLLKVCSCSDCHDTFNEKREPIPGKRLAGGEAFRSSVGKIHAPNITSDKATGIGAYSDDDLRRVFNEGVGKAGRPLYFMPWWYYKGMTDEDKDALIFALRQVDAVSNVVPPPELKK
ncbi:MAG: cytochrome c [Myxococcales bacterium]|nr:cytochrome c [Myxococcales bacterium]